MTGPEQLLQLVLVGVTQWAIYALLALGFVTIYNVTGIINFAQGEFAMLGAMLIATLAGVGAPGPAAFCLAVVGVALAALGEASSLWLWLLQCGKWVGLVVLAYFLVKSCGLDFGAFGISMFWLGIISGSSALLAQPAAFLKWNGAAALLVGLASGVLILVWLRRQADAGVNV